MHLRYRKSTYTKTIGETAKKKVDKGKYHVICQCVSFVCIVCHKGYGQKEEKSCEEYVVQRYWVECSFYFG